MIPDAGIGRYFFFDFRRICIIPDRVKRGCWQRWRRLWRPWLVSGHSAGPIIERA